MSRAFDRSCEQSELILEKQIEAARGKCIGISAIECADCGCVIPEQRRIAAPGCIRCIDCQDVFELKQKHYQGV